jgi:hypothetical protein
MLQSHISQHELGDGGKPVHRCVVKLIFIYARENFSP